MQELSKWNEIYQTGMYQELWGMPNPSQELVGFIATIDSPAGRVSVDVGCGAGPEAIFLAQAGFTSYGFDHSEEAIKIATANAANAGVDVTFQVADIFTIPLADQSVDLINDRGCLHTIANSIRPKYVEEMARILKPGGRIFVRGCREESDERFEIITSDVIDRYFGTLFTASPVLPIELANGNSVLLPSNLVILTKR